MNRLTASQTGDYSALSIRMRRFSLNQIQLQLNTSETPTEITYTIDQHPQIVKTLSGGDIVLIEDSCPEMYQITISSSDILNLGYWNHYIQLQFDSLPGETLTMSLDKGRVRVQK